MRRRFLVVLAGLATLVGTSSGYARVEADPNKEYVVTPEVGPWMICAASYTGPQSAQLAHELVLEIRSRFQLPAYVFNRGEKERQEQREYVERIRQHDPERQARVRITRIENQFAVLVGGYKDMDSARKALDDIKKLKPSNPKLMPFLVGGPLQESGKEKADTRGQYISPFMDSFVIRNPTVPQERRAENKIDPFLKQLNAGEKYSLLQCKEPWTMVVAVYQGTSIIQSQATSSGFLDKLFGSSAGQVLAASAQNAHNLAEVLRKFDLEAYVLHMRQGSAVTIGGYKSSDDPRMRQVQQALATKFRLSPELQLLPQPLPMEVPRP